MSGNVVKFPAAPHVDIAVRVGRFSHTNVTLDHLARQLGSSSEWLNAAIIYLKNCLSGKCEGDVAVSVAALHLILAHVEQLEANAANGGAA
jgi:hypothetical protein